MTTTFAPALPLAATASHLRTRHGEWLMVGGGLLLGTIGIFVEEAGQHPLTTVWFRCVFGALALLGWGAATGRLHELRLPWRALGVALLSGALLILNWALFFAAINRTSIAVATVVFHVQPLWVLALGAWWLRERVAARQVAATLVALLGLVLASGLVDVLHGGGPLSSSYLLGVLLCLGGSLSYAIVTLLAKHAGSRMSAFALAWWQCMLGVVLLAWWPVVHGWPAWGPAWGWLVGLGAIHTGLAYVVLYAGMARLAAERIAVLQFVYPAAAIVVDWLVYGRALGPVQMLGVLLMGLAIWQVRRAAPAVATK